MHGRSARGVVVGVLTVAVAAALTACSSTAPPAGAVSVVASTDVWGDVVHQITGDAVPVTSVITDPNADPHSFEANAQVELKLSKATLVVENGGGYDDFVDTMLRSLDHRPTLINAVDVSGKKATAGADLNEHVWYDLPTVAAVAARIAAALSRADPSHAAQFAANQRTFDTRLAALEATEKAIRSQFAGTGIAITEPVPLYLLDACGLVDRTPPAFSSAVEQGTGVSASVLADTLALFTGHQVRLLAYNDQTSGRETDEVLGAARNNGVAVVPVSETLPAGRDYLSWMSANLTAVRAALGAAG